MSAPTTVADQLSVLVSALRGQFEGKSDIEQIEIKGCQVIALGALFELQLLSMGPSVATAYRKRAAEMGRMLGVEGRN